MSRHVAFFLLRFHRRKVSASYFALASRIPMLSSSALKANSCLFMHTWYTCVYVCVYVYMWIHVHVCIYVYIYIYTCLCAQCHLLYIHIYTGMYVYIFKHTTYRDPLDYRIATIGIPDVTYGISGTHVPAIPWVMGLQEPRRVRCQHSPPSVGCLYTYISHIVCIYSHVWICVYTYRYVYISHIVCIYIHV